MSFEQNIEFLKNTVPGAIAQLPEDAQAQWGKMNAWQMVEHLGSALRLANGSLQLPVFITDPEKLAARQAFLLSDVPFKPETKSPVLPEEPLPTRFESFSQAKEKTLAQLQKVFEVYEADNELEIPNPAFGNLNYSLQAALLTKHIKHHLTQFGA
jgi:hypothetical protein